MNTKASWHKGVVTWEQERTAYLSVPFTWRLPEARKLAEGFVERGYRVIAGGPGVFTRPKFLSDLAEIGTSIPDTVRRHNPDATRASYGCPVGCWFCIVPKMDGKEFRFIENFPVRPILCDDNLSDLPVEYQRHIVARYEQESVPLLDANSGFEPKAFNEETYKLWKRVLKGPWRFGFDERTEGSAVLHALMVLIDEPARKKQVYTMIGHEPFDVCMDRIQRVIAWGGEPYAQPFIKLNALVKEPAIRHDWTPQRLKDVARWVNRHLWRKVPFAEYDRAVRTNPRAPDTSATSPR